MILNFFQMGRLYRTEDNMRAILWCNGDLPEEKIVKNIIDENITIFGIDGGANKAHNLGIKVHEII